VITGRSWLCAGGGEGTSGSIGRSNGSELDVGVGNGRVGGSGLELSGDTRGGGASSTSNTGVSGRVDISGVAGVEPEQVGLMVIPDGQDEDDTIGESLVDGGESSDCSEAIIVVESGLLGGAEVGGDRVIGGHSGDVDLGVLDDLAVLDVDTADFLESSSVGSVGGQELGDDGHLLGGIEDETGAIERGVTHAVRVEVASILVANTTISVVTVTALGSRAAVWAVDAAAVGSIGGGDRVGFPEIHLIAACAVLALSGIGISDGASPSDGVGLGEFIRYVK